MNCLQGYLQLTVDREDCRRHKPITKARIWRFIVDTSMVLLEYKALIGEAKSFGIFLECYGDVLPVYNENYRLWGSSTLGVSSKLVQLSEVGYSILLSVTAAQSNKAKLDHTCIIKAQFFSEKQKWWSLKIYLQRQISIKFGGAPFANYSSNITAVLSFLHVSYPRCTGVMILISLLK